MGFAQVGKIMEAIQNFLFISAVERHVGEVDDGIDSSSSSHGASNSLEAMVCF